MRNVIKGNNETKYKGRRIKGIKGNNVKCCVCVLI